MMDCVFCKIRDGRIPSVKIYDDERTFAIMDINPLNDGHLLVIPKAHAATLYEIAEDDLGWAAVVAKRIALALRTALRPDGLNVLQANGAAAFQSVAHLHLHLIPRWGGDGKGFDWKLIKGDPEKIRATGEKIRAAL
ncbi:MAG: HIT family protein [Candidatus Methylomirabilis oxyfera]|nr:HIT family protein [Candidatus Methylomirabilis oxyfera]